MLVLGLGRLLVLECGRAEPKYTKLVLVTVEDVTDIENRCDCGEQM